MLKKPLLAFCLLFSASSLFAQRAPLGGNPPSPALDPDYVILQSDTAYYGTASNQALGAVLKAVPPLIDPKDFGDVFISNLDGGFDSTGLYVPDSIRRGKQHAAFKVMHTWEPEIVFRDGKTNEPIIIAGTRLFLHERIGKNNFQHDSVMLARKEKNPLGAEGHSLRRSYINDDSIEDLFVLGEQAIHIYYGDQLHYRGDTIQFPGNTFKVIPADTSISLLGFHHFAEVGDFNQDGVVDIVYHNTGKYIGVVFGRLSDDKTRWKIDSVVQRNLLSNVRSIKLFDFLYNDGIPDLIIGTSDTIYCYNGARKDFLHDADDLDAADLKIPSPGKLDPVNFNRNGQGGMTDFGKYVFDAGNVNGSDSHALGVLFLYYPMSGSLDAVSYCFLYSGGLSANERADALFVDKENPVYEQFNTLDTVRTKSTGPSDILIDDFGYTAGGTGALWYIKGNSSIPHKADPRWLSVTQSGPTQFWLTVGVNPFRGKTTVELESDRGGELVLRDVLGRRVWSSLTSPSQLRYQILLPGESAGVYFLAFETASQRTAKPLRLVLLK